MALGKSNSSASKRDISNDAFNLVSTESGVLSACTALSSARRAVKWRAWIALSLYEKNENLCDAYADLK